jgi:hypothetical protein
MGAGAAGGGAAGGGAAGGGGAGAAAAAAGAAAAGGGTVPGSGRLGRNNLNFQNARPRSIGSLYELINSSVAIPGSTPQAPSQRYPSPLNDPGQLQQLLPQLLDSCTTVNGTEIPARINVNTASQTVLQALPGLTDVQVQSIITNRPNPSATEAPDPIYQTPAWLITQANFPPSAMQTLERYITARTQVYRVQVVGRLDRGGPTARVEAVIDTNQGQPRILYWRDLTELGKGFNLGPAGGSR